MPGCLRRRKEMQNAEAYTTRSQQDGKTGGGSREPTPPLGRWPGGGNSRDREGLPDSYSGTVAGRPADWKFSLPGADWLRKNSHRRGNRRVPAEGFSGGNKDRLRRVST